MLTPDTDTQELNNHPPLTFAQFTHSNLVQTSTGKEQEAVLSQLKMLVRPNYSNPPAHGAHIVRTVLGSVELFAEWRAELKGMADRIISMRTSLLSELTALGTPGDWSHITSQIGMFTFTGLSVAQSKAMTEKHHVYMLENGRISMAGINTKNVAYLAKCLDDVVKNVH
jgi:aspartate/tyrosine/aromatic aminotransferase